MKKTRLSFFISALILLPLLLIAGARPGLAQSPAGAQARAQEREDQFKRLIDLLEKQLNDKDKLLSDKDLVAAGLRKQIDNLQELDKNSAAKIASLEEQVKNLQDTREQLQTQAGAQEVIIQQQNARIASRDQAIELVKEFSKAGKRTTWEKLVEAIPSVAGLIAVSIAN
jgi:chromosome segregation ATPase